MTDLIIGLMIGVGMISLILLWGVGRNLLREERRLRRLSTLE